MSATGWINAQAGAEVGPWKLLNQVEEWRKAGIKVYSCYEAGACGYWYHRELTKCGAINYVVAPRVLENQRSKHQKTDRLDARALLDNLESYLRGNCHAMSIVAVPSPELEKQRCVARYREQLLRNRRRAEARGRALALSQGIVAPGGWWRPAAWQQFKTQLPEWMGSQLQHWQQEALAVDAKERQVRGQIEKSLGIALPIGVGALSWMTLNWRSGVGDASGIVARLPVTPGCAQASTTAMAGVGKAALTGAVTRWCVTSLLKWSGACCAGSRTIPRSRNCAPW